MTYYGPGVVEVPLAVAKALGIAPEEPIQEKQPQAPTPVIAPEPVALPADFPHADVLAENRITTYEAVPTTEEGLIALSGIGRKRAAEIMTALVEAGYGAE